VYCFSRLRSFRRPQSPSPKFFREVESKGLREGTGDVLAVKLLLGLVLVLLFLVLLLVLVVVAKKRPASNNSSSNVSFSICS
jgi:hypothetical protein